MLDRARLGIPVIHESDHDAVLLKPAGMASELTRDPRNESLLSRLRLSVPTGVAPRLVHRLDRVTRGFMVVTFTKEAAAFHGEQIREGLWLKYYLARIPTPRPGTPAATRLIGKHKAYIAEDSDRARLVRAGGKPSFLEVLAAHPAPNHPNQSHALIRLDTGRLHQIRVMLAGLGLPLIGDTLYAGPGPGPLYLDHAALWRLDYTTREPALAFLKEDPDREPLHPALTSALLNITKAAPTPPSH